jgi:hypothetical protein
MSPVADERGRAIGYLPETSFLWHWGSFSFARLLSKAFRIYSKLISLLGFRTLATIDTRLPPLPHTDSFVVTTLQP